MVNRYFLYPYVENSRTVQLLKTALNGKILRREGSHFHPQPNRKVINWGSSSCPWQALNRDTGPWSNKLQSFQRWRNVESGPRIPAFTTSRQEAQGWLPGGTRVVCRGTLTGHSGAGITVLEGNQQLPQVPLYVKYIPKDAEYRVHVFAGEVIDVQRKVRDPSREPSDWHVRSHANGFIYTRTDATSQLHAITAPPDVLLQARRAMASSGLVFGAVDVIFNEHRNHAYVLEVNTAPGLEGQSITTYANAIRSYYES